MLPADLTADLFAAYPPQARQLASANLALLRALPVALAVLLLKEVRAYDWKFPAEQTEVDAQFRYLHSLSPAALRESMKGFAGIRVPSELSALDWVHSPELFSQRFSAMLWASDQVGAFRSASIEYVNAYRAMTPVAAAANKRLTMIAIGQGVKETAYPLFRALRPFGVYYPNVEAVGGAASLLKIVSARSLATPAPFAHWYIDGGRELAAPEASVASISYARLNPLRLAVLKTMRSQGQAAKGPEGLQEVLGGSSPEQFSAVANSGDPVLDRFSLTIFTEGSGTQIFSTTFAQWTGHEVLRRAMPLTTFVRFAPRQTQRSMEELFADEGETATMDPEGALVDADMAAYYLFLNQRRLPDSDRASFLVWFEDHKEALMVSPGLAPGTTSREPTNLAKMLQGI